MEKIYVLTEQGYIPSEGFYNVLGCFKNEIDAYNEATKKFNEQVDYLRTVYPEIKFHEKDADAYSIEASTNRGYYSINYEVTESVLS